MELVISRLALLETDVDRKGGSEGEDGGDGHEYGCELPSFLMLDWWLVGKCIG
jgi:hypothetical protein